MTKMIVTSRPSKAECDNCLTKITIEDIEPGDITWRGLLRLPCPVCGHVLLRLLPPQLSPLLRGVPCLYCGRNPCSCGATERMR